MKKYLYLTIIALFIGGLSVKAQEYKDFAGQWEFNCTDAPEEYATGDLIISKKEKKINVKIVYTNAVVAKGESPQIKDGKLHYFMHTEDGDKIKIELKIEDFKINGSVFLADGETLAVTAKRKAF